MKKGPLVKVEISPGRLVKMYEADAIEQGLLKKKPPKKKAPADRDKVQQPQRDKGAPATTEKETPPGPDTETITPSDDFTTITGVGLATARALAAHGVTTFAQLRAGGALDFLNAPTNQAIEEWRQNG